MLKQLSHRCAVCITYDRYVDKPGVVLVVLDVGKIFQKNQEKDYMHISKTKPVWVSTSSDPFTCTFCHNLTQFSLKRGQNFHLPQKVSLNCK